MSEGLQTPFPETKIFYVDMMWMVSEDLPTLSKIWFGFLSFFTYVLCGVYNVCVWWCLPPSLSFFSVSHTKHDEVKVRSHEAATAAATATLSIGFHYNKWICSHSLADLRGGVPGTPPHPRSPNSSIFMQVSSKNLQNNPNLGVGAPPSGKSWIHHWHWCGNRTTSKWVLNLLLWLRQWQTNCFNCYLPHQCEHFGPIAAEKPLPLQHHVNGP